MLSYVFETGIYSPNRRKYAVSLCTKWSIYQTKTSTCPQAKGFLGIYQISPNKKTMERCLSRQCVGEAFFMRVGAAPERDNRFLNR